MANLIKAFEAAFEIDAINADSSKSPEAKKQALKEQQAKFAKSGVLELCTMANETLNNRAETDGMLERAGFNGENMRRDRAIQNTRMQIAALLETENSNLPE